MSTEICRLCGELCTPWDRVEALDGHICQDCGDIKPEKRLSLLVNRIEVLEEDNEQAYEYVKSLKEKVDYCKDALNELINDKMKGKMNLKEKFFESKYWGMSASIDLKNCDPLLIRDADAIKHYVESLCELIKMKRFGETQVVHFGEHESVCGFSMTQLIETSLISGHFANKTNSAYIDVFSCKYFDVDKVEEFTRDYFDAEEAKSFVLLRE